MLSFATIILMLPNVFICMRGTLAFFAILAGVGLSATGNIFASSLATMFPAVFLSTMVGLWISHEVTIPVNQMTVDHCVPHNHKQAAVPCGAVGPIMFGSLSVPWSKFLFCRNPTVN